MAQEIDNAAKKVVVLTQDQKDFIDANWDKLRQIDLVKQTFNNPDLDGRSFEGKAIKEYLGDREVRPSAYQKHPTLQLTEEQKIYIVSNINPLGSDKPATSTELAREIFHNRSLGTLNLETRAVAAYIKTLPEEVSGQSLADEVHEDYSSPRTIKQIVEKVNDNAFTSHNYDTINTQQKKVFEIILGFLKAPRFLQMINSYNSKASRRIFESEFIRTVHDKPDLTSDELNLCINLCWNYVQMITVNKHLDMLNQRYETMVGDPENKMYMVLAEMITAKTNELNACDKRQQTLIADLNGKRSERQKNKNISNFTMANLMEWWKDEDERRKEIRNSELHKQIVVDEVNRIENMQDFKARLMGFTKSELING